MKRGGLIALVLAGLMACGADVAPTETESPVVESEGEALFRDVLEQHQDLNRRVERVAFRVLSANADLCPRVERSAGFSVHTLSDYPANLQPLAEHMLGVDRGMSVRSVVADGPADVAGLEAGDAVRRVGDMPVAESVVVDRIWAMAERGGLQEDAVELGVVRDGERLALGLETVEACAYPVSVVYDGLPNAHTDGEEIFITSELVRATKTDDRLALILAHELAHALVHNVDNPPKTKMRPRPELELEADAAGLLLMARAGFDMEAAIVEMDAFGRTLVGGVRGSHPEHMERVGALWAREAELAEVIAKGGEIGLE